MKPGMTKRLEASWAEAEARVQDALKTEGFGVLTRIDVQATLREKLGVELQRYVILGACNPTFAHRALQSDLAAGLMLPCNVVLHEEGAGVRVHIVDPRQTLAPMLSADFAELADEVRAKLTRVLENL